MGARIPDIHTIIQAGINPKTGLPLKMGNNKACLNDDIKRVLRIIDEQDAVNRYVWYNLPSNITSQELERMLYYRGQLAFFYNKDLDEFYFMPYTLDGTIDFYGRYNDIHPVPFNSTGETKGGKNLEALLSTIKLHCVYGMLIDDPTTEQMENSAVLLHDYTKQMSQNIIPRSNINEPILEAMSKCIPYMNLNLLIATGISGVRVNDSTQAEAVKEASDSMENEALKGNPWLAILGNLEFQELGSGSVAKSEEYMLAMQSLDNFRLGTYGIENGGLFEKKAHVLEGEEAINGGPVGLVMQDGLSIRQNFCDIVNSIWGLGIWCEPSENINPVEMTGEDINKEGENSGVETGGQEDE